ncbi:hypothetical protein AB1Y20_018071 [Prymnesium parvum]|uniref:Uncharacterized protein n=1 Tax=Prymnesium parvum TaxID=97485 RepID=A0AB34JNC2_PRYPA
MKPLAAADEDESRAPSQLAPSEPMPAALIASPPKGASGPSALSEHVRPRSHLMALPRTSSTPAQRSTPPLACQSCSVDQWYASMAAQLHSPLESDDELAKEENLDTAGGEDGERGTGAPMDAERNSWPSNVEALMCATSAGTSPADELERCSHRSEAAENPSADAAELLAWYDEVAWRYQRSTDRGGC